jgi:hypothetical protein
MIGFGGFGGSPFPTRRAMGEPQSGQVQSDDEFGAAWKAKIDSVPQTIATGGGPFNLIQGADKFDAERANPLLATQNETMRNSWLDSQGPMHPIDRQLQGSTWDYANNMGISIVRNDDGTMSYQANQYTPEGGEYAAAQGASHMIMEPVQYSTNPEWTRINTDFQQSTKERGENQIRQQQAYDTMLAANGQIGGVMTDAYSNPNYGQISGQAPGANANPPSFGGLGGVGGFGGDMTGIQDTTTTGQYTGGAGRYNPSPFAPDAFQNRNPWAGL